MKKYFLYFSILISSLLWSCDNTNQDRKEGDVPSDTIEETGDDPEMSALPADTTTAIALDSKAGKIKLTEVKGSPEYLDAMLEMNAPSDESTFDNGTVSFIYDVKNYPLGKITSDAAAKGIANSNDGQHIHLIVNNEPYIALYKPEHKATLQEGHYTVLSFLSRSYHESIKNPEAYVLRQFSVGKSNTNSIDLNAPHLFYSRPKGEYKDKDTEKVLLDFYVVNAELANDKYKVKATINNEEFTLAKWAGYYIEGLPAGENTIRLELLDKDGKSVKSPYNPVERKITISKKAS